MLFMLSYHKRLQVKQIADHLGISKSASSQLLEPLNQKNLITRQTDPKDRRIAYFELTQEGRSQVKKLHKSKFAGLRSHLENLNEKELSTMVELTRKAAAPAKQNR
jgi:DNA-binding MarR family transcriptional regulator